MNGISVELTADNLDQVLKEFAEQVDIGLEMIGMQAKSALLTESAFVLFLVFCPALGEDVSAKGVVCDYQRKALDVKPFNALAA